MRDVPPLSPALMYLSLVIPVYDEAESLKRLFAEIAEVTDRERLDTEVILVDDGSRDGSWGVIQQLAAKDARVRGIRFRRNFGKSAALAAGVRAARGEIVFTMDADLQDDPAEMPQFLKALESGLDVVSGWKEHRRDPWHKVVPSRVFNFLVSRLTGLKLHDHNCGMKCYRAELFREIRLYGELHRFIPVLAHARGYRVGELAIHHRPRQHGRSKYGVSRFVKGFLDLLTVKFLTGYGQRPQHVLGTVGLAAFVAGAAGLLYLALLWLNIHYVSHSDEKIGGRPLLLYSISALLLGTQLMSIGLLAALMTAHQSDREAGYSIAEQVGQASADEGAAK